VEGSVLTAAIASLAIGAAGAFIGLALLAAIIFLIGKYYFRTLVQRLFGLVANRLFQDKYSENLMELWSALRRASLLNVIEISLRSGYGEIIKRPLGTSKSFLGYDGLMFVPAQLARLPHEASVKIDMQVKLGPRTAKPLLIDTPLLISGMGYGVALSEEAKRALARGAKQVGTAICSGEGPFLEEEYQEAQKFIWQISRTPWGRNPRAIAAADMIEVQVGQGARVGPHVHSPATIKGRARLLMGLSPVEEAKAGATFAGIKSPWDWSRYVRELRQEAGGKPLGVKLMAGGRLENDLAVALEAGFDVIVLDGAQGGTHGASALMEDDFGIPSLQALVRAVRYLREQGVRHEVSLIVGGGYFTPGECLKALALGADAIYLGTAPLFALVHRQIGKVMPWEPLTQLVEYGTPYAKRLDVDVAAQSVANLLRSMTLEMEEGIRALGKTSLADIGPNDLVALDRWTAEVTGVSMA